MMKVVVAYSRVAIPLLLGICIGVALSLIILPILEEKACERKIVPSDRSSVSPDHHTHSDDKTDKVTMKYSKSNNPYKNLHDKVDMDSFRNKQYEPKLRKPSVSGAQSSQKPTRPRFIASELEIKDTLLIAYLTTPDQLDKRMLALNRTLNFPDMEAPPVLFFTDGPVPAKDFLPIVSFNLLNSQSLKLLTIRYLVNNYSSKYKYFVILPDTVYIKSRQLKSILEKVNIDSLHLGIPLPLNKKICDSSVGVLMSQDILMRVEKSLTDCESAHETSEDIERCITLATDKSCSNAFVKNGPKLTHLNIETGTNIQEYFQQDNFGDFYFFSGIKEPKTFYKLHRYAAKEEITSTRQQIDKIRSQVDDMFNSINMTSLWPSAVREPYQTSNRYDVMRWTMTEGNVSHLEWDYVNNEHLSGAYLLDQQNVIKNILENLNIESPNRYKLLDIQEVYRRIDPTRGLEYVVTLSLQDTLRNVALIKSFEVVKPLTEFEQIAQPFPKDSTFVHVLVPIMKDDIGITPTLLDKFYSTFQRDRYVALHLVLINSQKDGSEEIDDFAPVKDLLQRTKKLKYQPQIDWLPVYGNNLSKTQAIAQIVETLPKEIIVLTVTPTTNFNSSFINRARENVIKGRQIFAPIAFWQYQPSLIYDDASNYPQRVAVSRSIGHFGEKWFDHLAFYVDDFKKVWPTSGSQVYTRIVDAFVSKKYEVLRAVDYELTVSHHERDCAVLLSSYDQAECSLKLQDHVGSAPILAKSLFQNNVL